MIFMFAFYTYECFAGISSENKPEQREHILSRQCAAIFLIHFDAFAVIYLVTEDISIADFLCGAAVLLAMIQTCYSIVLQQIIETFDEQSVHAFDDRVYHADNAFF